MPTDKSRQEDAQRILLRCSCGNSLESLPKQVANRFTCPACGQDVILNQTSASTSKPVAPQATVEKDGMRKSPAFYFCSYVAVAALVCIIFMIWYSYSSNQAKIAAANDRIAEATAKVNSWLAEGALTDSKAVEQDLVDALENKVATKRIDGESALNQARTRRDQLAEQVRIKNSQREATALFHDAKTRLAGKRVAESIALLHKYIANPFALEKAEAQNLLAEAEIASSEMQTFDKLIAISDEAFNLVRTSGKIDDGKVTEPVLLSVRNEIILRNLDRAFERRKEIKVADGRRRETERLAAIEQQSKDEAIRRSAALLAPLEVFLGGKVAGKDAAFWREPMQFTQLKKEKPASVFDADKVPTWDSAYELDKIPLANGVTMKVEVQNHDKIQQTEWSCIIFVADPEAGLTPSDCSITFAIEGKLETMHFKAIYRSSGPSHGYTYPSEEKRLSTAPIFQNIASAKSVQYRLNIVSTERRFVKNIESRLSPEAIEAIGRLMKAARYEDRQIQLKKAGL